MKRQIILLVMSLMTALCAVSQKVTIHAVNQPAAAVFRTLMEQTGKNFVYSSEILKDLNVTVNADNKPLKEVLSEMFRGTHITWSIKGDNVVLKPRPKPVGGVTRVNPAKNQIKSGEMAHPQMKMLEEVTVLSRLEAPVTETAEIGAKKITAEDVRNMPVIFGESDVIKTLHMQPGVTEGTEGMAGMYVHGGNADENLYMLDNVPIYHVNHFAGLFSAFNADAIRYIDFFKSSIPAKYDGRLSSFMDVRIKEGSADGVEGTAKLGLTSGSFNISGPIGGNTTYLVALRRSWLDILTIPALAINNSHGNEEKIRFRYAFMDFNARVNHRFSPRLNGFVSVYFGNDILQTGSKDSETTDYGWHEDDKYDIHWGNLVAQTGCNYRINPDITAEFTAAYTRYFSDLKSDYSIRENSTIASSAVKTENNINDWIFRGDFDWQPQEDSRIRFGAGYTRHSFLPTRTMRQYTVADTRTESRDSTWAYGANEVNAYVEDDWKISSRWRVNGGIHLSMFNIDGKTNHGIAPRLSLSYRPKEGWAVKAAYSRTTQYVHQLTQSYLALPTDQWIPITGKFKPQRADKISVGVYWQSSDRSYEVSVEAYCKYMHNLIDYKDEYYLLPPLEMWDARLTSGRGSAKGTDFKIEKVYGRVTGHIAYSLAWADRRFPDKNGGRTYRSRFDNRHTVNVVVNWNVSETVRLNAAWTGRSGNRFTFMPQVWVAPDFERRYIDDEVPLQTEINNYQLPFYHRLDLSCTVKRNGGYWTLGLYNAYNHMNTAAIRRDYDNNGNPVFQKVKFLPIIPSISYTWLF